MFVSQKNRVSHRRSKPKTRGYSSITEDTTGLCDSCGHVAVEIGLSEDQSAASATFTSTQSVRQTKVRSDCDCEDNRSQARNFDCYRG